MEKTYGRPAIGQVMDFVGDETSLDVLVKVEDNMVKIPVGPEKILRIKKENPAGSQISVLFYNCEWHIEDSPVFTSRPRQKIGIPIGDLLEKFNISAASAPEEVETTVEMPEENMSFDDEYLKDIEMEFRGEVDGLLKNFKLSHLKATN